MAEKFANLLKNNLHIQEAPGKIKTEIHKQTYLSKISENQRQGENPENIQEKNHIIYKGIPIRDIVDLPVETMERPEDSGKVFKILNEKNIIQEPYTQPVYLSKMEVMSTNI